MKKTLAALLLLGLAGCGTFVDVVGVGPIKPPSPHVYGGVRTHLTFLKSGDITPESQDALVMLLDLPASAILDTALLPLTLSLALIRGEP
ncbi:MAG TPA: YceK/YidQ family lipoprotein [Planctomycetota bacterium]